MPFPCQRPILSPWFPALLMLPRVHRAAAALAFLPYAALWIALSGCSNETSPGETSAGEGTAGEGRSKPAVSSAAQEPAPAETGRTLLLVTFDTTRADHLGSYGHSEAVTPVSDRLAAEGLLFERAYAPTPITLPSHASILTGVLPAVHGVRDNGQYVLASEATLVSEVLALNQWRTAAFVSSFILDSSFGLDQGFGHYSGANASNLGAQAHANERSAKDVVDDALDWTTTALPADDLFLWVHFYDPHWPYEAPAHWTGSAYDGEIARCDRQLGRLLQGLKQLHRGPGLTTVLTADHGESLGEKGELSHGLFLYESAMRVPLILSGATLADHAGTRLSEPVSIAAVAPTLLVLAGIEVAALPQCEEPALIDPNGSPQPGDPSRPLLLETWYPFNSYRWHPLQGLVWNGHKLIRGAGLELYNLEDDPAELQELAQEPANSNGDGGLTQLMISQLEQTLAAQQSVDWTEQRTLKGDELASLRALGYAGGAASPGETVSSELPDGRLLIGDTASLDQVRTLLAQVQGIQGEAPSNDPATLANSSARIRALLVRCRELLQPLQARHPGNPMAASYRGTVESALGEIAAAIPQLELALRANPRDPAMRFTLADSYQRAGRLDDALEQMLATLTIEPRYTAALNWMTWYRSQAGQVGQAVWWAEKLVSLIDPADPGRQAYVDALNQLRGKMTKQGLTVAADSAYPLAELPLPQSP